MGVTRNRGPTKPRAAMAAQRPPSPRSASGTTPPTTTVKTTVASSAPPTCRKEEEKLRGTSALSSVKSTNITANNTSRTKVILAASEDKDKKKNEEEKKDKNEAEDLLTLTLAEMSLNEDNDLNKKIKNLSIKDNQKEKEQSEESDLLSRGPARPSTKGIHRTVPYHEQYIVSSDNHGGATVLYPNISPPHKDISCPQHHQEIYEANLQDCSQDSGIATNGNYVNDPNFELDNIMKKLAGEMPFSQTDIEILLNLAENANFDSDSTAQWIDKIIESPKDDKEIQPIKQELCEGVMDQQRAPTTPDSAYDSDECSVGSPSSVTSGVIRTENEKVMTVGAPFPHVVAQPTNLQTPTSYVSAPISPIIQTVPVPSGMLFVLPKQVVPTRPIAILPQPQQQPQPLAPPSTPPPSPQGLRPILPGINIPAECNKCSEPAINRIRSVLAEQTKASAWALMFAYPDSKFTDEDDEGNMLLSCVLSNRQKVKNFMEVLYALIQRLKGIINRNSQMAYRLLATPNKKGQTPLDIACRFLRSSSQNALAVRYLADTMVEEGLPIGKEVDGNGNTLLHKLCACGDEACYIVAELLSMKDKQGMSVFNVNQKNYEGETPLHVAARTHSDRTSCTILAQLLMRSGADASVKEGHAGNTVFHLVARESCDPKLLLTLLAKTGYANKVINEKNFNEDTPLHMVAANHAISSGYQRLAVQHLIDYGADPKLQNKSRKSPLSLVAPERKQDIKNVLYHKRHIISQE